MYWSPDEIKQRVSFRTIGCKLNQAETATLAALCRKRGYQIVPFRQPADLTIINTCTVTNEADAKSRQSIHQAIQTSPQGKVAVVGCYAQVRPDEVAAQTDVDMILGNREKFQLLDLLALLEDDECAKPLVRVGSMSRGEANDQYHYIPDGDVYGHWKGSTDSRINRTRALLKIQDGCDYGCSYCIVPIARGKSCSRPLADCVRESQGLVSAGYREIVLTGANIGTWRGDRLRFHDLLRAVSNVEGLKRIRVSSIEPNLITDDIIKLVAERENIAAHFHIPLQHGSDRILKAMQRRYRITDYRLVLDRIAKTLPDAAIGADVIVGFPGETENDFQQLVRVLSELPLAYLHIFRYSEREGTEAAVMTNEVDPILRRERSRIITEIDRQKRLEMAERFLGKNRTVHFERSVGNGLWEGLTDNYLRVRATITSYISDPFQCVNLTEYNDSVFIGRLSENISLGRILSEPQGAL